MTPHQIIKEFREKLPREVREVYKQGDGSFSAGVTEINSAIESFLLSSHQKTIENTRGIVLKEVVDIIKRLEVGKLMCERAEVPYKIKTALLEETKQALLAHLDSLIEKEK